MNKSKLIPFHSCLWSQSSGPEATLSWLLGHFAGVFFAYSYIFKHTHRCTILFIVLCDLLFWCLYGVNMPSCIQSVTGWRTLLSSTSLLLQSFSDPWNRSLVLLVPLCRLEARKLREGRALLPLGGLALWFREYMSFSGQSRPWLFHKGPQSMASSSILVTSPADFTSSVGKDWQIRVTWEG